LNGDNYDQETVQGKESALQAKLQKMKESGVELYVDGRTASPDEIASRCVREDCVYMPDYVMGEKGKLLQLRFDKVNTE
jgi:hypothetical protein